LIILTGFGPYGKLTTNISGEIVKKLELSNLDLNVIKKVLPVRWDSSLYSLKSLLSQVKPQPKLVILLGIHESKKFNFEKYAWNFVFGKDVKNKFKFGLIRFKSPFMLRTIFNIDKSYLRLHNKVKISISNYPGIYLCNYIYYWALVISEQKYPVIFIHIPHRIDINTGTDIIERFIKTSLSIHSNII
jgi:pyroglutamyl-peptidase